MLGAIADVTRKREREVDQREPFGGLSPLELDELAARRLTVDEQGYGDFLARAVAQDPALDGLVSARFEHHQQRVGAQRRGGLLGQNPTAQLCRAPVVRRRWTCRDQTVEQLRCDAILSEQETASSLARYRVAVVRGERRRIQIEL